MSRILCTIGRVLASRALPPLVIGIFLLLYIVIAFFSEETLTTLIALSSHNPLLIVLFALLPLNCAARIVVETRKHLARRRTLQGGAAADSDLFDETVAVASHPALEGVEGRLSKAGYRTGGKERGVAAWRGVPLFPARILYLAGTFCLFGGILISLTTRTSLRGTVVEGEVLPPSHGEAKVEKIVLSEGKGAILAKKLDIQVADTDGRVTSYGLYPPSRYRGAFVYPRYLGVGLVVEFSAPDLPAPFSKHCVLNIYPPGREASVEVPGSPYTLVFSLADAADGSDPYVTGKMQFLFKVTKGNDVVFTGSAPSGGEAAKDGFRLRLPDSRRLAITDFISDSGVSLIWLGGVLFLLAAVVGLAIRIAAPRREMVFRHDDEGVSASFRAEGRGRRPAAVFHEMLDFLEAQQHQGPHAGGGEEK